MFAYPFVDPSTSSNSAKCNKQATTSCNTQAPYPSSLPPRFEMKLSQLEWTWKIQVPWSTSSNKAQIETKSAVVLKHHITRTRLIPSLVYGRRKTAFSGRQRFHGQHTVQPLRHRVIYTGKRFICFPSTLRRVNLKTQQSPVILDLCLKNTQSGKSHDHRDAIVFKSSVFKMVSVHTQNKTKNRRFQIPPVWRAFLKSSVFVID